MLMYVDYFKCVSYLHSWESLFICKVFFIISLQILKRAYTSYFTKVNYLKKKIHSSTHTQETTKDKDTGLRDTNRIHLPNIYKTLGSGLNLQ